MLLSTTSRHDTVHNFSVVLYQSLYLRIKFLILAFLLFTPQIYKPIADSFCALKGVTRVTLSFAVFITIASKIRFCRGWT